MTRRHSEPGRYLDTLAYRCTPNLVGDDAVYLRHLSAETRSLWEAFERSCKDRYGNESAQAPYSIAITVLTVLTGGYVHFEPRGAAPFLASREPIDAALLRRVFTLTHGLALGQAIGDIDLRQPPLVAQHIADTPQQKLYLADHIQPQPSTQPIAPNWVFNTIAWGLAEKLAGPWKISDSRTVTLRADVTGGLVALDDPWENETGGRYALSRTDLTLQTMPNIVNPVLIVTSRVTRISDSLIFSKKVLAVQPGKDRPILEVPLHGGGGARTISRYALEALGRLEMDYSILQAIATRSQDEQRMRAQARAAAGEGQKPKLTFAREHPGLIWPVQPKSRTFPIGVGTGMQHLRLLNEHVLEKFDRHAEPLVARATDMKLPHRPSDSERLSTAERARRKAERDAAGSKDPLAEKGSAFPEPASIAAAVKAAGFSKLRLVCLWYQDETRLRMLGTLAKTYGLDTKGLDPHDGQEIDLHGGTITATFHLTAEFLAHGTPDGRTKALTAAAAAFDTSGDVLIGAWCETHFPTAEDGPGLRPTQLQEIDAKLQTKTILARKDIASQYLLGSNANGIIEPKKTTDHPAEMALLDLYRSLGIIDDRIGNALRPEKRHQKYGADRLAHLGFHIRQQNKRKGEKSSPKTIVTATALIPPATPGDTWQLLGWTSTAPRWQPYRTAQNQFHATPYPPEAGGKKSYRQRWDDIGALIETALEDLVDELDGRPYTVTVDEDAARRIWAGLQNNKQGSLPDTKNSKYWLPGYTLVPDERPDAIIRVNIADKRVPPPISVTNELKSRDAATEDETTKALFEVTTDFGTPVWILSNVPRNYDGSGGGRLGAKYTRWDAQRSVYSEDPKQRRKGEMPEPWYTMTATEIFPIALNDRVVHEALAIATAQLCHQTLYWTDRVRYPVPLHAAIQMDLDHPQYRRAEQSADDETDIDDDGSIMSDEQ